ncbi:hypothetical protein LEP1GSC061_3960 [Leptospira wolffii serovar Khorat str. Khorat-H2]|nr:hypothetical protein LEP1GSC061_3960 [Leptospira wolffii serovar Khorat str. Khorat-H2]
MSALADERSVQYLKEIAKSKNKRIRKSAEERLREIGEA